MASLELQRLWKLAQADNALTDIRHRAASLDIGQNLMPKLAELEKEEQALTSEAKSLSSEALDLELQQKTFEAKITKFGKELYGGKVVNPREVENIEKEIGMLRKHRAALDERILELWEITPPAQALAETAQRKVAEVKAAIGERRKVALVEKAHLEAEFKRLTQARADLVPPVAEMLLTRYEAIRQRCHGIGMVEVTKKGTCSGCGLVLPEKTRADLNDDRVVACEGCRRLLYWTDGVI